MNRCAAAMVANSLPPAASPHDWWCYLVVTAVGGRVLADKAVVALYRQHGDNVIGAPLSWTRRAIAAVRRGPGIFINVLRQHLAALTVQPELKLPSAPGGSLSSCMEHCRAASDKDCGPC